jgi:UDP-N-acetyl-D-mannosaminuronic acid transferase (WecB/TagA/CpsF family)
MSFVIPQLPTAPEEYDPVYMNQLVRALQDFMELQAKSQIHISNINFEKVPSSRTDATIDGVYIDAEVVKVRDGV